MHCQVNLVFTADDVMKTEKNVNLCKLDVYVKNRTAIAVSVGCFKLE